MQLEIKYVRAVVPREVCAEQGGMALLVLCGPRDAGAVAVLGGVRARGVRPGGARRVSRRRRR